MGQLLASTKARQEANEDDDVKRQVDSGGGERPTIYELVDVKTGGGKLIDLIKTSARRQSCSIHLSSSDEVGGPKSGINSIASRKSNEQEKQMQERALEEQIRRLVEPLLYEQGAGKEVPLSHLWRLRFNQKVSEMDGTNGQKRLVCWRLDERGFVGETALHICFLLATPSHMILAQKLLKLFPALVHDTYTCDRYFGETCLHMAIVNEDIRIVKWLLDKGAAVGERCLGGFFLPLDQQRSSTNLKIKKSLSSSSAAAAAAAASTASIKMTPDPHWSVGQQQQRQEGSKWLLANEFASPETNYDGYCYWGEFPLSFAASLGLSDCYRLLLAKGANPNWRDSNGNSTLHICVIVNKLDMFDLCYSTGAQLELINDQQLSALALAAKLERVEMFFHILNIRQQVGWILCDVCFQQIALDGLDTICERDGRFNEHSLLCLVVSGSSNAHLRMLDGLLAELLQVKWRTSIEQKFNTWFRCFLVFLFVASLAYITRSSNQTNELIQQTSLDELDNDEIKISQLKSDSIILRVRHVSETILLLFVLYYLTHLGFRLSEKQQSISARSSDRIQLLTEAPELAMFTLTCILLLLCIPLRLAHFKQVESWLASTIMFLLPLKLLFFFRASRQLGSFIVVIYKILVNDVLCFVVFLIIFVAGFSQSFLIIFKTHKQSSTSSLPVINSTSTSNKNYFSNLFDGIISMHMMALNEFSLVVDELDSTDFPLLAKFLFCLYMILVSILLINMLIAMLGKTYQDIASQPNESLRQWARALLTVERLCSPQTRLKMLDRYSHKADELGRRFYNSTRPLKGDQRREIKLVEELRHDNEVYSKRLERS